MHRFDDLIAYCSNVATLAEGGQKSVLTAIHPEYGAVVIKEGHYGRTTGLDRISREAELLRQIDSPYYPKQFELLIDPADKRFLIIEQKLNAQELSYCRSRFSTDQSILHLLQHLVRALSIIWSRNVVHRDIKPGNILIDSSGTPKIIDLGIARFLDESTLTASYAAHGPATPIYASPEQLMNKKTMISMRTDLFLLGIVVLELMHGFHPFDPSYVGNDTSIVDNILTGSYVPPKDGHDESLLGFIRTSLQSKPYRRFRALSQVHTQLGMDD